MGIKTKIEFADSTINPVMGCTGCELYHSDSNKNHCYAATLVNRYAGRKGWPKDFNKPEYFLERMEKALRWSDLTGQRRENEPWLNDHPRIIFVNDLSDGFCPDVDPKIWLQPFMKRMAESPHIWLLLTKWPKQMAAFFEQYPAADNFHLGVSITNQRTRWRSYDLLNIQTSVRLLSLEPLLEPLDLVNMLCKCAARHSAKYACECGHHHQCPASKHRDRFTPSIDGVFLGGESGQNARPMHPGWARDIRDQCQATGVSFLFKQHGGWLHSSQVDPIFDSVYRILPDARRHYWNDNTVSSWVGKKRSGRLLDGQLWEEYPERISL